VARPPELIDFDPADPGAVLAAMDEVARAGAGWLNLEASIDPEDEPPPRSRMFGLFSGTGPEIPLCTWVPGKSRPEGAEPTSLGIQHASGPKAAKRLAEAGMPVPERWRVVQDHPRRGLVVLAPPEVPHADELDWLLRAGAALSVVPLAGRWRAGVYRG